MSRWDLLPKNITDLIFQFDPTYHNIHKDNLKFLQKEWSIKYINKQTGSWGWDITTSYQIKSMTHNLGGGDVYDSIAYRELNYNYHDSSYWSNKFNFNKCQKICKDLNHKYSTFYHIPDHLQLGDIYDFDKHFFIREYASINFRSKQRSIEVYPIKWRAFKDKMKKIYKI